MKEDILYQNKWFKVIDRTDDQGANMSGIQPNGVNVVVLPYTVDENGYIKDLGIVYEVNPLWGSGKHPTVVSGNVEDIDDDILSGAMRELLEETGYLADDANRWTYLGTVTNSKVVSQEQPAFSVDITGLEQGVKTTDGTINEALAEFKLIPVKNALFECNDVYIPTLFMRLFRDTIEKSLSTEESTEDPTADFKE